PLPQFGLAGLRRRGPAAAGPAAPWRCRSRPALSTARLFPLHRRRRCMKFLLLVYIDQDLLGQLPQQEYDGRMRYCVRKADEQAAKGILLGANKLEPPPTARTVRVRDGQTRVYDGPFAETKEVLAGYNLIEADSLEQAVELAKEFPWTRYGAMEVRPVADLEAERARVGA